MFLSGDDRFFRHSRSFITHPSCKSDLVLCGWFSKSLFFFGASQYDLELVFVKNSHEFVNEYLRRPEFTDLMRRLGALGDGNQDQSKLFCSMTLLVPLMMMMMALTQVWKNAGTLSQDEWDVAYLYLAFVLRKVKKKHTSLTFFSLFVYCGCHKDIFFCREVNLI